MKKQLPVSLTPFEIKAGWIYWLLQLYLLPLALSFLSTFLPRSLSLTQLNFIFFALDFTVVTALLGKFLLASCRVGLESPFRTLRTAFCGYILSQAATYAVAFLIFYLKPDLVNLNDATIAHMLQENYALTAIGTVLLAPITEEILYRGVIFGSLYGKSRFWAYTLSSVIFALIHLLGYLGQYDGLTLLLCFFQYLPAGLCLAWAYAHSGTLIAPVLVHIVINQMALQTMRY